MTLRKKLIDKLLTKEKLVAIPQDCQKEYVKLAGDKIRNGKTIDQLVREYNLLLKDYYDKQIFEQDPFAKLDQIGVGKLVEMATKLGRSTRPDLHLGICGEHGGEPSSVEFCNKVGLDYVSCSPFRVPIARLAAAQAAIKASEK